MALFRNFGVNRRNRLCGARECASAQFLDFLEPAEICTFLERKRISALYETVDGHFLTIMLEPVPKKRPRDCYFRQYRSRELS